MTGKATGDAHGRRWRADQNEGFGALRRWMTLRSMFSSEARQLRRSGEPGSVRPRSDETLLNRTDSSVSVSLSSSVLVMTLHIFFSLCARPRPSRPFLPLRVCTGRRRDFVLRMAPIPAATSVEELYACRPFAACATDRRVKAEGVCACIKQGGEIAAFIAALRWQVTEAVLEAAGSKRFI
jgi:hypothetical protein